MSDIRQFLSTRNKEWSAKLWDGLIEAIQARLAPLEEQLGIQREVTEAIIARGLTVIEQELAPIVRQADQILNESTASIQAKIERFEQKVTGGTVLTSSATSATLRSNATINLVIVPADREFFAPTPYVAISRASTTETWAIAKVNSFYRATGSLSVTLEQVTGPGGPYSDWIITSLPGATLLQKWYYEQTVALRQEVATDRKATSEDRQASVAARDASVVARNASQAARAGSEKAYADMREAIAEPLVLPTAPVVGQLWWDGTMVRVYDGVAYVPTVTISIGGQRFEEGTFGPDTDGVVMVRGGFTTAMVFLNGNLLKSEDYTAETPNITIHDAREGDEYFIKAYLATDATDYDTREETEAKLAAAKESVLNQVAADYDTKEETDAKLAAAASSVLAQVAADYDTTVEVDRKLKDERDTFPTVVGMSDIEVAEGINAIRVTGYGTAGDGFENTYVDEPGQHGWRKTFVSGGATARTWWEAGDIREPATIRLPAEFQFVEDVLAYLAPRRVLAPLEIVVAAGVTEFNAPLFLSHLDAQNITIRGADPIVATITPESIPSVTATSLGGTDYHYDITFAVHDTAAFAAGDYVTVRVTGPTIDASATYDMTRAGCRVFELSGGGVVTKTGAGTITVRNHHRNSSDRFPTGAIITVIAGTITKYPTVLKFSRSNGVEVGAVAGELRNLAIVGDGTGTFSGIIASSYSSSGGVSFLTGRDVSFSTFDVMTYNWGGPGIFIRGARSRAAGTLTTVARSGRQGIFARDGAAASFPNCIVNATGQGGRTNIGYGFVSQGASRMECAGSISVGNRNSGFYADFAATMECPSCVSMGNGNYAGEDGTQQEGKGFEAETGSMMSCRASIGCFNVSYGFYADAASKLSADQCVGSHNTIRFGFYALHASEIYARNSVAIGNGENGNGVGFLARRGSKITAYDTLAIDNALCDYRALDQSHIQVSGFKGAPVFDPPLNWRRGGGSCIGNVERDGSIDSVQTISDGAITVPAWAEYILVSTGGSPANLDNINGAVAPGQTLVIRPSVGSPDGDVTIRHNGGGGGNTGNIRTAGGVSITLRGAADKAMLVWDGNSSLWYVMLAVDF